jgi:tetratricopeptide (TPR) repeat protein
VLNESAQMHLAASLNCVGVIMFNEEACKTDEVLAIFDRSLQLVTSYTKNKRNRQEPRGSNDLLVSRATVLNNIGRVYFLRSEFNEAAVVYDECLELRRRKLDTDSIDLGATLYNIGMTYFQLNRFDEALSYYHDFLSIQELRRNAGSTASTKDIALVHKGIADIHFNKSESQMALYHFTQALQDYRASQEDTPDIEVASLLNHMGSQCYILGDFSKAIKYYEEGLQIEMTVLPPHHVHITITLTNMGHIYRQLGEYKNALAAYRIIHEVQLQTEDTDHLVIADTLACIGLVQYHLQDHESSFESYISKAR